jgi:metal-responsive CopG/Arc/MetJ family transcriptional regulator
MKTSISLPDPLFTAADALADRLGMSRSELYATALAELVAKHTDTEVTARLNEVYADEESSLDPALHRAQWQSVGREEW